MRTACRKARAWDYIFGITALNDITARDIQNSETQYTRAKSFDTFAPFGPCIAVGATGDPRSVEGWVNGERRQASTTAQLIFPLDFLVEYITFVMTLEPGDIISTGTPSGVGVLKAGRRRHGRRSKASASSRTGSKVNEVGFMKIFIDSGNIKDIETLAAIGIIDGVTTNPSLLAKEPGDYRAEPQEDLRHRQGAGQRRGRRHRFRRHDPRRPRHRQDR